VRHPSRAASASAHASPRLLSVINQTFSMKIVLIITLKACYSLRENLREGRALLRCLSNHRLAFRLTDITLEPLTQILGELLISDEAAKVIGKLILEDRLEA
jgi:hypothetical protein